MDTKDKRIVKVSDWIMVSELPASDDRQLELDKKNTSHGVYQVALSSDIEKIGDNLIHEDICYTGESASIHARTYAIRQPKGSHGASRSIREKKLNRDEVLVRICYTEDNTKDHKTLETDIHTTTDKMYGKKFKWKEASAGNDGLRSRILDDLSRLPSDEILDMKGDFQDVYFKVVQQETILKWSEA